MREPRLPDPGLAEHGHDAAPALGHRLVEGVAQALELRDTTDERKVEPSRVALGRLVECGDEERVAIRFGRERVADERERARVEAKAAAVVRKLGRARDHGAGRSRLGQHRLARRDPGRQRQLHG